MAEENGTGTGAGTGGTGQGTNPAPAPQQTNPAPAQTQGQASTPPAAPNPPVQAPASQGNGMDVTGFFDGLQRAVGAIPEQTANAVREAMNALPVDSQQSGQAGGQGSGQTGGQVQQTATATNPNPGSAGTTKTRGPSKFARWFMGISD